MGHLDVCLYERQRNFFSHRIVNITWQISGKILRRGLIGKAKNVFIIELEIVKRNE